MAKKELHVVDVVEKAFSMFSKDAGGYIKLYTPVAVLVALTYAAYFLALFMDPVMASSGLPSWPWFLVLYGAFLGVVFILGLITHAGAILKADAQTRKKKLGFRECFSLGSKKLWKILATTVIISALATAGLLIFSAVFLLITLGTMQVSLWTITLAYAGMIVFMTPGIYISVRLLYALPATVLEKDYGISRSWNLSRGRWWTTFGLVLLLGVISGALGIIPFAGVILILLIMNPVMMIAYTLAYKKLK